MAGKTVLKKLKREKKERQFAVIVDKHAEMFRLLEMVVYARSVRGVYHPRVIEDVISFCYLFRPVGIIPESISPAEYYSLAYHLHDLVLKTHEKGFLDSNVKKTAVRMILDNVKWANKYFRN